MLLERSVALISPPTEPDASSIDVERVAQAAAYLIGLSGDRMPFGRLMLMLYLADRQALFACGRPITFDDYAATPFGPIPVHVARLILGPTLDPRWQSTIRRAGNEDVASSETPSGRLSKHDRAMLQQAHASLDGLDVIPTLERIEELCPEWLEHLGREIPPSAILVQGGESLEDARAIQDQIASERRLRHRRERAAA